MRVIPINNGYYQYKSIENQMCKSRLSIDKYGNIGGTTDILEFDNVRYIVGAGKAYIGMDKSNNQFTKIFVLNMLSRFTQDKEDFKIVLSAPPLVYGQQKDVLPEYIIGKYDVVHNSKKKIINILDVKIFPETIAAYVVNMEQFKGKNVIVLDIGGLTTNGVLIKNGGFTKDDVFTLKHGMYHLDFEVSQYLLSINLENGFNCNEDDIQYFRDSKDKILDCEGVIDIYRKFLDDIVEKMDDKNWNYIKYEVLITGGGGKVLFNTVREFALPQAVLSIDPLFDNLKGLEALGKKVWGNIV